MLEIENEEVSWQVLDLPVSGTVTKPRDGKSHPAVIFVAGSGPTDRNWCSPLIPGINGSGRLLAEALAGRGFATIRYDKMASGPRVTENLPKFAGKISMQTHIEELSGAVDAISNQRNIDKDNVFALTNSEGAIHAVNYVLQARKSIFRGLVLTGPPGRSIAPVARMQIYNQVKLVSNADAIMKNYDAAVADFVAGRPITMDPSLPQSAKSLLLGLESAINLPFSRELWNYSLSDHIAKITVPMLLVIGKKDIQIDWQADGRALEQATLGKTVVSFTYSENANHVLKNEGLPRELLTAEHVISHYNSPDAVLDAEAADSIISWLEGLIECQSSAETGR